MGTRKRPDPVPALRSNRAVFVDKDGTLIPDIPYNVDPHRITLTPGAADSLRELQQAGYRVVVISNQAGVARGLFKEAALRGVEARLADLLAEQGVQLDGFFYCPHHPEGSVPRYAVECACRKPAPGMLHEAARWLGLDLSQSWMVGDILTDSEAGRRAGCRTILVEKSYDPVVGATETNRPDYLVTSWGRVAAIILASDVTEASGERVSGRGP